MGIDTYPGDDAQNLGLPADPLVIIAPLTSFAKSRRQDIAEMGGDGHDRDHDGCRPRRM
jgi:hypothetical protein